jgi:hypothetical protein
MRLDPLSKSTYSTWETCHWKAHAHKNLGIESISGPAAVLGQDTHQVIQSVLKKEVDFSEIDKVSGSEEIADLARKAFSFPPPTQEGGGEPQLIVEQHGMVNSCGEFVLTEKEAMIHGYMDVFWKESETIARFRDWKSGFYQRFNPFESHLYAIMTKAFFPGVTRVIAELCFLRSGDTIRTQYDWQDNDSFCIITHNTGREEILWAENNPILEYFLVRIKRIHAADPIPMPGNHCTRWYGNPCQFLGQGCPLTDNKLITNVTNKLDDPKKYAKALRNILQGKELNATTAGDGLYAVQQIKQMISAAESNIEKWSLENGTIKIGDSSYGWKEKEVNKVDVPFVIETLIEHEVPIEDWAKIINISKTSIGKLPKRQYQEVREILDVFAISTVKGRKHFTELK